MHSQPIPTINIACSSDCFFASRVINQNKEIDPINIDSAQEQKRFTEQFINMVFFTLFFFK